MSVKKSEGFTAEERAAMRERAKELKAEAQKADGESAVLAKIAQMPETDRAMAERLHERTRALAEDLVRDARVCQQGRQGSLLLPERREVQREVRYVRLQRQGEPRRGRHVADLVCAEGVDRRRRGKDRRAREDGSGLSRRVYSLVNVAPPSIREHLAYSRTRVAVGCAGSMPQ
jgi:hypothetical protein